MFTKMIINYGRLQTLEEYLKPFEESDRKEKELKLLEDIHGLFFALDHLHRENILLNNVQKESLRY